MSNRMPDPWKTRSSRYLLSRWWMRLREDHVVLPDGKELEEFHVIEYPDWACTVCVDEDGRFVLVDQYRHGIGRASLELAAGAVDDTESPLEAARRELREETGYVSDEWHSLGALAPEPSRHTNWAHLFVALSARRVSEPAPDDGEHVTVCVMKGSDLATAVESGRIVHGLHVAALCRASAAGLITIG